MFPRWNTHIVGQGLARLTDQFVRQPNIRTWLATLLSECQALENATWQVLTMRSLATAPVQQLPATNAVFDVIGEIVGQPRNGMSDLDYKSLIYLRIASNRATGAVTDWSRFGQILLRTASGPVGFWGDQSSVLFCVSGMALNAIVVAQVLAGAVPNGQRGVFAYTTWPDGYDVAFGSVYDPSAGQQGYGSVYDSTAGGGTAAGAAI